MTVVNNKVILHLDMKKCIVYQIAISLLIGGSFALSYGLVSNIQFSVVKWILVAAIVSVLEVLICSTVFLFINHKAAIALMEKIKFKCSKAKN